MPSLWMSLPWVSTPGVPTDGADAPESWQEVQGLSKSVERARQLGLWGLALGVSLGVSWLTWSWRFQEGLQQLQETRAAQLVSQATALEQLLEKNLALPRVLAQDNRLQALLSEPQTAASRLAVNQHLSELGQAARVAVVYLLDAQGQVLASSNWQTSASFLGRNYSFRPYFQHAVAGGVGMLYAVGTVTHEPGLFVAQPVRRAGADQGEVLGVIVVKFDVMGIERTWAKQAGAHLALADDLGVLLLSSEPSWRYHSLTPLSQEDRQALAATQRYGRQLITPLSQGADVSLKTSTWLDVPSAQGEPVHHLLQSQALAPWGWHLLMLSEVGLVRQAAALEAALAGVLSALSAAALGLWRMQRGRSAERRALSEMLEHTQAELERRSAEHARALTRAQPSPAAASAEALEQTRQFALLEQVAASLSHELNPSLNALLSCTGQTVQQLEQSGQAQLREGLDLMLEYAGRLGQIMGQLRGLARLSEVKLQTVSVPQVLGEAMMQIAPELRRSNLSLQTHIADDATRVQADPLRLVQVLVNLLNNAVAASQVSQPHGAALEVHVRRDGQRVHLRVRDHGPGLQERTSLALHIAHLMAQSMQAQLQSANAAPADGPGVVFTLSLKAG